MNAIYDVIRGFKTIEQAKAYAEAQRKAGRTATAMINAETQEPIVIEER